MSYLCKLVFCLSGFGFAFVAGAQSIDWPVGQALPRFPEACLPLEVVDTDDLSAAQIALLSAIQGSFNVSSAVNCAVSRTKSLYLAANVTEGKYNWLQTLSIPYQETTFAKVIDQYAPQIKCALVYDPGFPLTLNLATHLASRRNCVVVDPALGAELKALNPKIDVNAGLLGKFKDKYQLNIRVIEEIRKQSLNPPRLLLSITPGISDGIRELAYALKDDAFVFYMTLLVDNWKQKSSYAIDEKERAQFDKFAQSFGPNTLALGFYEGEVRSIRSMSEYKVPTVVGTSYHNYSIWSSLRPPLLKQKGPTRFEPIQNKLYLNLVVGDGDNMSYVQHFLKTVFDTWAGRGKYPINWTIAPALIDAGPSIFSYFMGAATPNDYFVAGPSGLGYFHPSKWGRGFSDSPDPQKDQRELEHYWKITGEYMRATGLKVVNVVNDRERLTDDIGSAIQKGNPALLGIVNDAIGLKEKTDRAYLLNGELPVSSLERRVKDANEFRAAIESVAEEFRRGGGEPLFVSLTVDAWQKDKNHGYVNSVLDQAIAEGLPVEPLRSDEFFTLLKSHLKVTVE